MLEETLQFHRDYIKCTLSSGEIKTIPYVEIRRNYININDKHYLRLKNIVEEMNKGISFDYRRVIEMVKRKETHIYKRRQVPQEFRSFMKCEYSFDWDESEKALEEIISLIEKYEKEKDEEHEEKLICNEHGERIRKRLTEEGYIVGKVSCYNFLTKNYALHHDLTLVIIRENETTKYAIISSIGIKGKARILSPDEIEVYRGFVIVRDKN